MKFQPQIRVAFLRRPPVTAVDGRRAGHWLAGCQPAFKSGSIHPPSRFVSSVVGKQREFVVSGAGGRQTLQGSLVVLAGDLPRITGWESRDRPMSEPGTSQTP